MSEAVVLLTIVDKLLSVLGLIRAGEIKRDEKIEGALHSLNLARRSRNQKKKVSSRFGRMGRAFKSFFFLHQSEDTMDLFIQKFDDRVTGQLSGWDRLVFRGSLRMLCFVDGMMGYLSSVGVLLKHFGEHAQHMTRRLIASSIEAAEQADRPIEYLHSPKIRKDEFARDIAIKDDIQEGLICVLTCVEPCRTYEIYRNRDKKKLELKSRDRKCKFIYHYWIDPRFGFMSARIQTWFPFGIQICINGREWLARRMDADRTVGIEDMSTGTKKRHALSSPRSATAPTYTVAGFRTRSQRVKDIVSSSHPPLARPDT